MRRFNITSAAALVLGVAACAPPSGPPSPPGEAAEAGSGVEAVDAAAATAELEGQIARLEIQVLERDAQLAEMREQLQAARQELVRNMAKLQSLTSRAEAASGIAEAEIAVESLARSMEGAPLNEYDQARALIGESSTEFSAGNFGGALYLATEARALARSGQARLRTGDGQSLRSGESLFARPIPIQTTGRSNVRSGPGLDFRVLHTLDPATTLIGHSYTDEWVRIVDDGGREGWIFHTLVTSR